MVITYSEQKMEAITTTVLDGEYVVEVPYECHSAFTENGSVALSTSDDPRVDFFTKVTRNTPAMEIQKMLDECWLLSHLDTVKLIFQLRDCRGGKGERKQFVECMKWLASKEPMLSHRLLLSGYIPFYGRWKDMNELMCISVTSVLFAFFNQLDADLKALEEGRHNEISLAAKYAPSEGSATDRKYKCLNQMTKSLGVSKSEYRKTYLAPLRKHLNCVERHLTDNPEDWMSIDFSHVPSQAMSKYKSAFAKHTPIKFANYLESVKKGESKMNVQQLAPHEIIGKYFEHDDWKEELASIDYVLEAQWKIYVELLRKTMSSKGKSIAMVDVSGSMKGQPLQVAISLGILLSELNEGVFKNKVITFSTVPQLIEVKGDTLLEKIKTVNSMNWDMSTNIDAAFELLLKVAVENGIPKEDMPSVIYILSDMQFDASNLHARALGVRSVEVSTEMKKNLIDAYASAGYHIPSIVYWNLRGDTKTMPAVSNEKGVCCVSGFSPSILNLVLDGEEVSPMKIMRQSIDNPRYDPIERLVKTWEEDNKEKVVSSSSNTSSSTASSSTASSRWCSIS